MAYICVQWKLAIKLQLNYPTPKKDCDDCRDSSYKINYCFECSISIALPVRWRLRYHEVELAGNSTRARRQCWYHEVELAGNSTRARPQCWYHEVELAGNSTWARPQCWYNKRSSWKYLIHLNAPQATLAG